MVKDIRKARQTNYKKLQLAGWILTVAGIIVYPFVKAVFPILCIRSAIGTCDLGFGLITVVIVTVLPFILIPIGMFLVIYSRFKSKGKL